MLFNSLEFAIFLPIVFILYWSISAKHIRVQNALVVVCSYVFYGWWDWRFLTLIFTSTVVDYFAALRIEKAQVEKSRKRWLLVSILVNLGLLGVMKYYNFFVDNFISAFTIFGMTPKVTSLNIILPVGISFYTFQTLSYTIDVYRRKLEPTRDFIAFMAFISFFPQLVAGPIERATNLLPQFLRKRTFDYTTAVDGMRQMLWGFFKKMAVADTCAVYVDSIFASYQSQAGSTLFFSALLFSIQIYCDFSGYSDIAIGTGKLLGIKLMQNFNYPLFSRDIAEFWRRWHISLSTWFRDYVYIPLGGSRVSTLKVIRNTMVLFLVSGLWHGANWTFIIWGAFHSLLFLPLIILKKSKVYTDVVAQDSFFPSVKEFLQMSVTFILVAIGLVIFRADTVGQAFSYFGGMFDKSFFSVPLLSLEGEFDIVFRNALICLPIMLIIEWLQRRREHGLDIAHLGNKFVRYSIYIAVIALIWGFHGTAENFIYFQF